MMGARSIILSTLSMLQIIAAQRVPVTLGPPAFNTPGPAPTFPMPFPPTKLYSTHEKQTDAATYLAPGIYYASTSESSSNSPMIPDYTDYNKYTDMTTSNQPLYPVKTSEQTKSSLSYLLKSTTETKNPDLTTLETMYLSTSEETTVFPQSTVTTEITSTKSEPPSSTATILIPESTSNLILTSAKPTDALTTDTPSSPARSTSSGIPTKYLSTSKTTAAATAKTMTTSKLLTTGSVLNATTSPKMSLEEILLVFSGIEHEHYFQRLPLEDRVAIYELAAGVQGYKIKEVMDHMGHERLLTIIYNLPMKFIEPLLSYLIQGLRTEREMH